MNKVRGLASILQNIYQLSIKNRRIRSLLIPTVFITVVMSSFPTISNYVLSRVWNYVQLTALYKDASLAALCTLAYIATLAIPNLVTQILNRINDRVKNYFSLYAGNLYSRRKADLDFEYYDNPEFNDLLKNADDRGVTSLLSIFNSSFQIISLCVSVVLSLTVLSFLGWQYVLILILLIIPYFSVELLIRKREKVFSDENRKKRRYGSVYAKAIGTEQTKVFCLNEDYLNHSFEIQNSINDELMKFRDRKTMVRILLRVMLFTGAGFVIYQVFTQALMGKIMIGTATFQISAIWAFVSAMSSSTDMFASFYEDAMYASDLMKVIELPTIIANKNGTKNLSSKTPEIEFENVSFKYPGQNEFALENVSFRIKSGEKVAFVGENGGGKSTAIKLLLRFYDPLSGRILIDGIDLRDINLESYRNLIGYVKQNPSVPSLYLNDLLSHEGRFGEDDIKDACRRSRANKFIEKYENGYNQRLGKMFEGGVNPSAGQSQRLAIACAYSKQPKLLVFDEPTSDLDPDTQNHFFNDYYHNNEGRTGIIVAHFLQGVIESDKIIVFENAKVTESGSHAELCLKEESWYKHSFEVQFEKVL